MDYYDFIGWYSEGYEEGYREGFKDGCISGQLERIGMELEEEFGNDRYIGQNCIGNNHRRDNDLLHARAENI